MHNRPAAGKGREQGEHHRHQRHHRPCRGTGHSEREENSLLYYGALKDVLGDNRTLAAIVDMEKDHLTQVMKYLIEPDSKVRGTSDDWT